MSKKNILGRKFKELRLAHGLTGIELAKRMGLSQGTISLLEAGKLKPTLKHANALSSALLLEGEELESLNKTAVAFLSEFDRWQAGELYSQNFHSWEEAFEGEGSKSSVALNREEKAKVIEDLQLNTLGGLLQTTEYAGQFTLSVTGYSSESSKGYTALKLERQKALFDSSKQFRFLIGEAALMSGAFHWSVMEAQIEKLKGLSELPNVEIRFLPLKKSLNSHSYVSFTMYDRKLTVIEGLAQELTIWTEEENKQYADLFDRLMKDSVTLDELDFVESGKEERGVLTIEPVYH